MTLDYETLEHHRGHDIAIFVRYDETAGLECKNCDEDIYQADNPEEQN
jgi:hypothetical protein